MKPFLVLCVSVASIMIGFYRASRMSRHKSVLERWREYLACMQASATLRWDTLPEAVWTAKNVAADDTISDFSDRLIKRMREYPCDSFSDNWKKTMDDYFREYRMILGLSNQDQELLNSIGMVLETNDRRELNRAMEFQLHVLDAHIGKVQISCDSKSSLSRRLGILFALAFAIILIG